MTRRYLMVWAMGAAAVLLVPGGAPQARDKELPPQFKYTGGTEDLPEGCDGNLEVNPEVMTFRCWGGAINVPYPAITSMEYRSEPSKKIRKMKIKWKVRPGVPGTILKSKKNRYFTVVYRAEDKPRVMVLRVEPLAMRPYLAELDLRSDKRVDVEGYEED